MTALPPAPDGGANPGTGPLALGSLCTGYAGLDMAVSAVLDVRPAWVADPDPGAAAILAHHWPDVPNLGDITAVDWTAVPPIDVLAAGFPCQDISYAGRGAGIKEGTRSGLWHTIADAVRVLRPRLLVLENVRAIVSRRPGLDVVLGDLARLGFDAVWTCVRASDVGAPHQRWRWFLVAHPADLGRQGQRRHAGTETGRSAPSTLRSRPPRSGGTATDAAGDGRDEGRPEPTRLVRRPDAALRRDAAADAPRLGHGHAGTTGVGGVAAPALAGASAWGSYGPAIERWARVLGRPAPRPTEPGRTGDRLSPRFVEWLMGLDAGHVTAVPGLTRNAQLRALGNGVVPAQGAAALSLLLDRIGAAA